jgi:hypothetical protein
VAAVAPGRGCEKPPPPRAGCPAGVAMAAAPAAVGIAGMRAGVVASAGAAAGWAPGSPAATRLKSKTLGAGRLGRTAASAAAPGADLHRVAQGVGCGLGYILCGTQWSAGGLRTRQGHQRTCIPERPQIFCSVAEQTDGTLVTQQ